MKKKKCKEWDLISPKSLEELLEHIDHEVCDIMGSKAIFYDIASRIIKLEKVNESQAK